MMKKGLMLIIIILPMIITFFIFGHCDVYFTERILGEIGYDTIRVMYTISPDSKWLIWLGFSSRSINEPYILLVINLETGLRESVKYIDNLSREPLHQYGIYWKSENNLILVDYDMHTYYSLQLEASNTSIKKIDSDEYLYLRFRSNYEEQDENTYDLVSTSGTSIISNAKLRFAREHPEFQVKKQGALSLFYRGKEFATYQPIPAKSLSEVLKSSLSTDDQKKLPMSPEAEKISLPTQYPYLHMISFTPNLKYIFYVISWSGAIASHNYLYCLDTVSSEVVKIDEHFSIYTNTNFMRTTVDSKKFIYGRKLLPNKLQIIELVLQ